MIRWFPVRQIHLPAARDPAVHGVGNGGDRRVGNDAGVVALL